MQVLELMKTHVITTRPEATLGEAVDLMDLYQVRGLPVVDASRRLCGFLMESDALRAMRGDAEHIAGAGIEHILGAAYAAQFLVQDFMTRVVLSVSEHGDALQAAQLLLKHNLTCLPVIDELDRVVGMLNRIDIIQAVFERLL